MNWKLSFKFWEDAKKNEMLGIAIAQVAEEFEKRIPAGPALGYKEIEVTNDLYYDHRIYWPVSDDKYKMGLVVQHETYAKAVNQFAHELGHIYCDPRVINWFTETISHMSSLYFLEYFSRKWSCGAPDNRLEKFACSFQYLKNDLIKEAFEKIDLVQHQVSGNWLKRELRKIQNKMAVGNRVIYNLAALEILPVFQEKEIAWQLLPYIGKAAIPEPVEDASEMKESKRTIPDFKKLRELVPAELKEPLDFIIKKLVE